MVIISLIIVIVGSVLMTVLYMSDKNKKIIQSMPIEKLKLRLKTFKNLMILFLVLLLIFIFIWFFYSFNAINLFSMLFPIYVGLLNIWFIRIAIKHKEQEQLLTD